MIINGLILAAGNSSRLGQPKQLVKYKGEYLVNLIENELSEICDSTFIVLGAHYQLIEKHVKKAQIVHNQHWQQGMHTSLSLGVKKSQSKADGLLIALSDQPLIPQDHYQLLIEKFNYNPASIIATQYAKIVGVPAIFPQSYFDKLQNDCSINKGAQSIIKNNMQSVCAIQCESAEFDLDTPDQLKSLLNQNIK